MKERELAIKQLDRQLAKLKKKPLPNKPKGGWVRAIRKVLGMTTAQLAKRVGVSNSRIFRIEEDEKKERLTMKTLYTMAEALDCDFFYVFIPKKSLQVMVERQMEKVIVTQLHDISHNMLLEGQALSSKQNKEQIKLLKNQGVDAVIRKLWDIK